MLEKAPVEVNVEEVVIEAAPVVKKAGYLKYTLIGLGVVVLAGVVTWYFLRGGKMPSLPTASL